MLNSGKDTSPEVFLKRRMIALGSLVVALLLVVCLIVFFSGKKNDHPPTQVSPAPASTIPTIMPSLPGQPVASASAPSAPAPPIMPSADYCTNSQIAVYVSPDKPEYAPEEQPQFTIVVTNIGTVTCTRDLGTGVQKVIVDSNNTDKPVGVWSNSDCSQQPGVDMRQLKPGQQETFKIAWTKYDSVPQCTTERKLVPPGKYSVQAQLGDKASEFTPFVLK